VLGDTNFMHSLEEFDKDNIPEPVIKRLKKYIDDPQYNPETVGKQSRAAMSLCMWSRAMDVYHRWAWGGEWSGPGLHQLLCDVNML
jgi:dynein heavy chain